MVPNRVRVSFPSLEDGNRFSLRNAVVSSYLEYRTMGKYHEPSDSQCYTLSSEPFTCQNFITIYRHVGAFNKKILNLQFAVSGIELANSTELSTTREVIRCAATR
jgi:hypothetical protein